MVVALRPAAVLSGVLLATVMGALPGSAGAASVPAFEVLLGRLDRMPSQREADALLDAAASRAEQARARPNPVFSLEAANGLGSGEYRGYRSGETTLSVSQSLELWGRRRARVDAAEADMNATALRGLQQRWRNAGMLALIYAEAEAAVLRFDLATEALALTEADGAAVHTLEREGRVATLHGMQADSETEGARAALDEATATRDAAMARLSVIAMLEEPASAIDRSLLNRQPRVPGAIQGDALAVRVADAELESARRALQVEQLRSRPDVSASLGTTRFQDSGDRAMTIGIALSIPLFDQNTGAINAAQAERRAAEARLDAQRQEAEIERRTAEASLRASNSRHRAADSGVSAAEEAYRLARIGFDAGRISQLELRGARTALIAARHAVIDARLARVRAEIDLARLEGRAPFGDTE